MNKVKTVKTKKTIKTDKNGEIKNTIKELKKLYKGELKGKPFFTSDFVLRWDEMDVNGHVYYANYLNFFSEARIETVGVEIFADLREQGIGPVVYRAELDFVKEVSHPDNLHVVTCLDGRIGKTRIALTQLMYSVKENSLVAKAKFYAIFINTKTRKPIKVPEAIIKRLTEL